MFRIGSDALGTARAIVAHALAPALAEAGLPSGAVTLLDSPARAAGWALFAHPGIALAVARGSGPAVEQLGAVARQAGTPVSLHGTGGAWLVAGASAAGDRFAATVAHSLDRKVCNTLNVACIPEARAAELVPRFLDAVEAAAARRGGERAGQAPRARGERGLGAVRAGSSGRCRWPGPRAPWPNRRPSTLGVDQLGREWEWEDSPEVTLAVVASVDEAVELFNRHSPRLAASLVADDPVEQDRFWAAVDAPFVGDGFTRWVDGQFALGRPELGLSNWQHGRLLARSAVLSGDSVHTIRTRAYQSDPDLHR